MEAKASPPIDSVSYQALDDGLHVYVNSHDALYYRWAYQEDWEFHSPIYSAFVAIGDSVYFRKPDQLVYTCYQSHKSSDLLLNNISSLSQQVVSQQPITFVDRTSEKLSFIYSIVVKQYAFSQGAYKFWQIMQKNTENMDSIFDAQPSQLTGNIHNVTNKNEPVIGYISAGDVAQKRIYIERAKITRAWNHPFEPACTLDTALYYNPKTSPPSNEVRYLILTHKVTPFFALYYPNESIKGYLYTSNRCGDCTTRGVTKKPSFWPY